MRLEDLPSGANIEDQRSWLDELRKHAVFAGQALRVLYGPYLDLYHRYYPPEAQPEEKPFDLRVPFGTLPTRETGLPADLGYNDFGGGPFSQENISRPGKGNREPLRRLMGTQ